MKIIAVKDQLTLARFDPSDRLTLRKLVHPSLESFKRSSEIWGESEIVVFEKSVYLILKGFNSNANVALALFFVREVIPNLRPSFAEPQRKPRTQAAFRNAGMEPIYTPPSFKNAIIYPRLGEIVIADFREYGTKGWITTEEIEKTCLEQLPPIVESGKMKTLYLLTHPERPTKVFFDGMPEVRDDSTTVVQVDYDEVSFRIKKLIDIKSGKNLVSTSYYFHELKYLSVGVRLPSTMRSSVYSGKFRN